MIMKKNVADFDGEFNPRSDEHDEREDNEHEDEVDEIVPTEFNANWSVGFQSTIKEAEAAFYAYTHEAAAAAREKKCQLANLIDASPFIEAGEVWKDSVEDKTAVDFRVFLADGLGTVRSWFNADQSTSSFGYDVCPFFTVVGDAADPNTGEECLAIQFRDLFKRPRDLLIPRSLIAEGGNKLAAFLAGNGFDVPIGKKLRERVQLLLHMLHGPRVVIARRTGWHSEVFVLPKRIIGDPGTARIITDLRENLKMGQRGSYEGWQGGVAERCQHNSRLLLGLSLAFASSLLRFAPSITPSMIHLFGPSSIGKSTAGLVAGSVWGGSEESGLGFSETWNGTLNAHMSKANARSGTLYALDEMRTGENVTKMAYSLSSGQGRGRLDKSANLRSEEKFSVFSLSTGEVTFEEMERIGNQRAQTFDGAEMRLPSIPADAGAGLGLFEDVHGEDTRKSAGNGAALFANRIQEAARENYGWAGPLFVERLLEHLAEDDDPRVKSELNLGFANRLNIAIDRFVASLKLNSEADDAVKRLARTFGLIAAAGQFASDFEVVPIPGDEMVAGVRKCFNDWLLSRGGARSKTAATALVALRDYISKNMGRFVPVSDAAGTLPATISGYRQPGTFYLLPSAWKEVLATAPRAKLPEELDRFDLLIRQKSSSGNTDQVVKKLKNGPAVRVYAIDERILEVGNDGTLSGHDATEADADNVVSIAARKAAKSLRASLH